MNGLNGVRRRCPAGTGRPWGLPGRARRKALRAGGDAGQREGPKKEAGGAVGLERLRWRRPVPGSAESAGAPVMTNALCPPDVARRAKLNLGTGPGACRGRRSGQAAMRRSEGVRRKGPGGLSRRQKSGGGGINAGPVRRPRRTVVSTPSMGPMGLTNVKGLAPSNWLRSPCHSSRQIYEVYNKQPLFYTNSCTITSKTVK